MAEKRITVWVQRFKDRSTLVLQWIDPTTGKRKSKSAETADEKEAEDKRADLEYELNHGRYQEASRMTWARFRELFEDEYVSHLRAGTQKVHRTVLDLFEKVCGCPRLSAINERTVSAFASGLRKLPGRSGDGGMQASTIKARLEFLHTALSWAAEQKLIPGCPKFPKIKVPEKAPQPIPAESFERMLAKAPDSNTEVFLLTGWLAGLRLSEALALEWEETDQAPWVDFARNRIILPAGFVKAAKYQWVPLDPVLRKAMETLPRHGKTVFHFAAKDGHQIAPVTVSRRIVILAQRAGVRLSMHALRKGFGCRFAGKVPAQVLQKLMRHANIAMTMKYYANIDDAVEEAVLGPQRNSSRNNPSPGEPGLTNCNDVKAGEQTSNGECIS
jgi:integrase